MQNHKFLNVPVESSDTLGSVAPSGAPKHFALSDEKAASSSTVAQYGRTLKYKYSYRKNQNIGNKNDLLKTISSFRNEHSMLRLLSMIEPNYVWIVAM
jgi:hypothetical protein